MQKGGDTNSNLQLIRKQFKKIGINTRKLHGVTIMHQTHGQLVTSWIAVRATDAYLDILHLISSAFLLHHF